MSICPNGLSPFFLPSPATLSLAEIEALTRRADGNDATAQCEYAELLESGRGVSVNLNEAANFYKFSADQGNADGQNNYGVCLESGTGVCVNLKEASNYHKLSADQGNSDGQKNYGFCLEHGKGVCVNLKEASNYHKLSADQGHADGQNKCELRACRSAIGVLRNESKAGRFSRLRRSLE
jgi:TPR repeat protein